MVDDTEQEYTDEEILSELRELKRSHGRVTVEILRQEAKPTFPSTLMNRFGSLAEAKEEAGINGSRRQSESSSVNLHEAQILSNLREIHRRHGEVTRDILEDQWECDIPTSEMVVDAFGSLKEAKRRAGLLTGDREDDQDDHCSDSDVDERYESLIAACEAKYGDSFTQMPEYK